jgi:hypothetical protein
VQEKGQPATRGRRPGPRRRSSSPASRTTRSSCRLPPTRPSWTTWAVGSRSISHERGLHLPAAAHEPFLPSPSCSSRSATGRARPRYEEQARAFGLPRPAVGGRGGCHRGPASGRPRALRPPTCAMARR